MNILWFYDDSILSKNFKQKILVKEYDDNNKLEIDTDFEYFINSNKWIFFNKKNILLNVIESIYCNYNPNIVINICTELSDFDLLCILSSKKFNINKYIFCTELNFDFEKIFTQMKLNFDYIIFYLSENNIVEKINIELSKTKVSKIL